MLLLLFLGGYVWQVPVVFGGCACLLGGMLVACFACLFGCQMVDVCLLDCSFWLLLIGCCIPISLACLGGYWVACDLVDWWFVYCKLWLYLG